MNGVCHARQELVRQHHPSGGRDYAFPLRGGDGTTQLLFRTARVARPLDPTAGPDTGMVQQALCTCDAPGSAPSARF